MVAAKAKKAAGQEDIYYVGVQQPVELRRTLLEASRITLKTLHSYERFKHIKQRRLELTGQLRSTMKDLGKAIAKLKSVLPSVPETPKPTKQAESLKQVGKGAKKGAKATPIPPAPKQVTELQKLEREIASIEEQMH
ncbi:hypothetical protein COY28_01305, partial [Candidatus Woesearchaeota archaeon CG_4_10_14_0_2_um_filter_57_5]